MTCQALTARLRDPQQELKDGRVLMMHAAQHYACVFQFDISQEHLEDLESEVPTTFMDDIILFDTDIPTALLDELDDPRIVPQRRTRLVIHRTRMSIEPRKDFLARLVAALSSQADDNAADGEGWGGGEGRGDRADEEGSGRQET
ncbi:hypothetical protein G3M48_005497 [Beauveria asiatica]|uniref:Uncharacterized protein n=1 Tax=Beauveria asiatica TaxID=1069075 RepID=A0AAW0RS26_9HYPO